MRTALFFLALSALAAAIDHIQLLGNENNILEELKSELGRIESIHLDTRSSRARGNKRRFCGARLAAFVFATCGECKPGSNVDLSVLCCTKQCAMEDVIGACCPGSLTS
ncbi:unnamed protein product [Caenorhabditis sp. 36 PRJEB53466]|nr:unnamed protein product [Caenorhabditis sp. 36 PRJEB53466]